MDIHYHYFVIKTLAVHSGFSEEEAQTIAYYSQQVDDFTKCQPMYVEGEPPEFFTKNGFAKRKKDNIWMVVPHPTGIDVVQSLEDHYRHTTLAPFHFLPPRTFYETERSEGFTRADYRCVSATDSKRAVLVGEIISEAVNNVKRSRNERSLMELGMALHTYADTYAHCGYSGLSGWENKAVIKKAYNQVTKKKETSAMEHLFYKELPHIGHGNSGHVPDICSYQIDVAMLSKEKDKKYSAHIKRNNLKSFLECSHGILDMLCDAAGSKPFGWLQWRRFSDKLAAALPVKTSDESSTRKKELAAHWKQYFPDISYSYDKNERFYKKEATVSGKAGGKVQHPTQAFYDYNELSYKRAKKVLGTEERFETSRQLLIEAVQAGAALAGGTAAAAQKGEVMQQAALTGEAILHAAATGENVAAAATTAVAGVWNPRTKLGRAIREAGFRYSPQMDILYSAMDDNVQRMSGHCQAYDDVALAAQAVIDSEPVHFLYDGQEWKLELRKGQYGIGTGCEIGLYYREAEQEKDRQEEELTGKLYSAVPDDKRIGMRLLLRKGETVLFERDWKEHWWMTGYQWGIFSQPEQLTLEAELRFPNEDMKKAFLEGADSPEQKRSGYGLAAMGYDYEEKESCTVRFDFTTPYTEQPAIREKAGETMQRLNEELVRAYNEIKEQHSVAGNDPDVIDEMLTQYAGVRGMQLHEKLLAYYRRKKDFRENVSDSVELVAANSVFSILKVLQKIGGR